MMKKWLIGIILSLCIILFIPMVVVATDDIKGDMNHNNKIDLKDIILLIKEYLNIDTASNEDIIVGDMNDNGKIDLKDIILLIKKYLNIDIDDSKNIEVFFISTNTENKTAHNDECIVFKIDDKIVMIDTGVDNTVTDTYSETDAIIDKLKEITGEESNIIIDYLIISHGHGDHTGNLEAILSNDIIKVDNIIYKNDNNKKSTEAIIDKFGQEKISNRLETSNLEDLSYQINNKVSLKLFNLKNIYRDKDCSVNPVCGSGQKMYRVMFTRGLNRNVYGENNQCIYLSDMVNNKLAFTDSCNVFDGRYYAYYIGVPEYCGMNGNSIVALFEVLTKSGKKYIYIPSDLENNGYSIFDYEDSHFTGEEYGSTYWYECNDKNLNKVEVLDSLGSNKTITLTKFGNLPNLEWDDSNTTFKVKNVINPMKVSAEHDIAMEVKNYLGDNLNNIVIYQAAHHGRNNSPDAINTLNLNREDVYTVFPSGVEGRDAYLVLHYKNYTNVLGNTQRFTVSYPGRNKGKNGVYCYIMQNGNYKCSDY